MVDKHINQSFGTTLDHGQKTVTTAGTAVILLTATETIAVIIKAKAGNTGDIYIGDSDVTSANGYILDAGEVVSISLDHKSDNIYINSSVNAEGVSFLTII